MRSHRPPTHVAYPAKRFVLLTGWELLWLAAGVFLGMATANATAGMTPLRDSPVVAAAKAERMAAGLAAQESRDALVVVAPATVDPLLPAPSTLPAPLVPYAIQIRFVVAFLPFAACFATGMMDAPAVARREIAFLVAPKRYVLHPIDAA